MHKDEQSLVPQPWCDHGDQQCCGSAWGHKGSLLDMAAPAQSSVFLQKTAQKFKTSPFSLFPVLAVQLSYLEGYVHHVPFIIPGK